MKTSLMSRKHNRAELVKYEESTEATRDSNTMDLICPSCNHRGLDVLGSQDEGWDLKCHKCNGHAALWDSGNLEAVDYCDEDFVPSFKESVYELAFGDDAINKEYTDSEVLARLKEFSDNALKWEEAHGNG